MIDVIKKTLLAGVGAALVTKEKVEETLNDYVRQGKVKSEDARIIADKIAEQGRKEFEDLSQTLFARLQEMVARGEASGSARIAALEQRLRDLEAKIVTPSSRSGEP